MPNPVFSLKSLTSLALIFIFSSYFFFESFIESSSLAASSEDGSVETSSFSFLRITLDSSFLFLNMTGPSFLDPKPVALEAPSKQAFEIILTLKKQNE